MTEISLQIKLPENQLAFFMDMINRFNFIEVEQVNGQKLTKEELFASLRKSLEEVELHRQGKIRLPTIEEVLHE